jgi:hypothetical protein
MKVYHNGTYITDLDDPYNLESWGEASSYAPDSLSLDLAELKVFKEAEIRDEADRWYRENVRSFEGSVTVHKSATGAAMTADEGAVRSSMVGNYQRVRDLVGQVRATTDWRACRGIMWTPPLLSPTKAAVGSLEREAARAPKKRKKRAKTASLEELAERVAVLEEDLEERRTVFGET